jgi:hypothetical protein
MREKTYFIGTGLHTMQKALFSVCLISIMLLLFGIESAGQEQEKLPVIRPLLKLHCVILQYVPVPTEHIT